jgi:hypothetical protein
MNTIGISSSRRPSWLRVRKRRFDELVRLAAAPAGQHELVAPVRDAGGGRQSAAENAPAWMGHRDHKTTLI